MTTKSTAEIWYAHYREGYSIRQTAKHFNVTHGQVGRAFLKYGLPRRTKSHGQMLRRGVRAIARNAHSDHAAGVPIKLLASKYHCTERNVHYMLASVRTGRAS